MYFDLRRDLFGLGADALFAGARGARERLPIRSIANVIQEQIDDAGLTGRISPADLGLYGARKLISEGIAPQDVFLMVRSKGIPKPLRGGEPDPGILQGFHPLHS